jgi:hypothetical protein
MPMKSPGTRGHHDVPEEQQGRECKNRPGSGVYQERGDETYTRLTKKMHGGEKIAPSLAYVVIEGARPTQEKKNDPTLKNHLRCCVGKSVGRRNASHVRKANEKR